MHLVHPQKFVFNFSWDDCKTQDNSEETMVTDFFLAGRGGGKVRQWVLWSMWKWWITSFWIPRKPLRMGCWKVTVLARSNYHRLFSYLKVLLPKRRMTYCNCRGIALVWPLLSKVICILIWFDSITSSISFTLFHQVPTPTLHEKLDLHHRRPRRNMCHWMNILIFTWTN